MATSGPRRGATSGSRNQRSSDTRAALVAGAIEALGEVGFAGARARDIAGTRRLQPGPGLLPLRLGDRPAAGSAGRGQRPTGWPLRAGARAGRDTLTDLIDSARAIFSEDLDAGLRRRARRDDHRRRSPRPGSASRSRPGWLHGGTSPSRRSAGRGRLAGRAAAACQGARARCGGRLPRPGAADASLDGDRAARTGALRSSPPASPGCSIWTGASFVHDATDSDRQENRHDPPTPRRRHRGVQLLRRRDRERAVRAAGRHVRTLTGHPDRAPVGEPIDVRPLNFDDPAEPDPARCEARHTLYNTYWVRFAHGDDGSRRRGGEQPSTLFAGRGSGRRRAHRAREHHPPGTSTRPSRTSAGRRWSRRALGELGVSHAILRPAIFFGGDDVLVNNIAWLLRHLPVFADRRPRRLPHPRRSTSTTSLGCASSTVRSGRPPASTRSGRTGRPSESWSRRYVPLSAVTPGLPVPGPLYRSCPASSGWPCATSCSRATSTRRWPRLRRHRRPVDRQDRVTDWIANTDRAGPAYANELHRHFRAPRRARVASSSSA